MATPQRTIKGRISPKRMTPVIRILVHSLDLYSSWYPHTYPGFYVIGITVYYIKTIFFALLSNSPHLITIYYLKGMLGNHGKWFIKDK